MTDDEPRGVTRRAAIGFGFAAVGSLTALRRAGAQNRSAAQAAGAAGELLIRGGHVLTVDPAIGELPRGDVHLRVA